MTLLCYLDALKLLITSKIFSVDPSLIAIVSIITTFHTLVHSTLFHLQLCMKLSNTMMTWMIIFDRLAWASELNYNGKDTVII